MKGRGKKNWKRRAARASLEAIEQQAAGVEPKSPIRRMADSVLLRMLDEHMVDSLDDLNHVYHKLASSLGAKAMKFEETIRGIGELTVDERAAGYAMQLSAWRAACTKYGMEPRVIAWLIQDGANIGQIAKTLKVERHCVKAHMRACLCVWSLWKKRCDPREVYRTVTALNDCCDGRKERR